MLLAVGVLGSPAWANIGLEFRPDTQAVAVGHTVSIGLYAVSDAGVDHAFAAIDLLLGWDPGFLRLMGVDNTGAIPLLYSDFPATSPYGLNEAHPPQDGDGHYVAWAFLGNPVLATPEGVRVTAFQFQALAVTPGTLVDMLESAGDPLGSTTVWNGEQAQLDVTGTLGDAIIEIVPEPASLALLTVALLSVLLRRERH